MNERYDSVSFNEIFDTQLYNIHPFLKDEAVKPLEESILIAGILHPPTILETETGKFEVVCGRQRLRCANSILKESQCFCRILPRSTSPEILLHYILEDQFLHKALTIIEQGYYIDLCRRILPEGITLKSFIHSLLPGRITYGLHFLDQVLEFDTKIQRLIHSNLVSEKIVGDLRKFDKSDQLSIIRLIDELQLGNNNQKKLMQFIIDILSRTDISLSSFLTKEDIREILNHQSMNVPQKSAQFLDLLYKLCHPLLSTAQQRFQDEVKTLKLPGYCKVMSSKSFEKEEVTLAIQFKNLEKLKDIWPEIAKNIQ